MGYNTAGNDVDDLEKLRRAAAEIVARFGSVDNVLESLGLSDMPTAQRYGILFGFLVFTLTLAAVVALLVFGGSFQRLTEQSDAAGQPSTPWTAHDVRSQRALLLEQLLESRERMKAKYPPSTRTEGLTKLTSLLLNEAPRILQNAASGGDKESKDDNGRGGAGNKDDNGSNSCIPPLYQENYEHAYRKCQDRPGGSVLSGRPEARFEAYARGYAGCGPYVSAAYRRSYGRLYEAVCCESHATDDTYAQLFQERPNDIIGRLIRLEALEVDRHLSKLFEATSGEPALGNASFDPQEIWSFQPEGPFVRPTELRQSFVFQRQSNEAGFAIVHSVTNRLWGAILLTHDDPTHLSVQLEVPLLPPSKDGTPEQLEACFLVLDRLFAHGYRRIQYSIDAQDATSRKLASRLGMTLEGVLHKHCIVKDANRDSTVYSLLNSDWKNGARAALFAKLYGKSTLRADTANELREEEFDEQTRVLAEQKQKQEQQKSEANAAAEEPPQGGAKSKKLQ